MTQADIIQMAREAGGEDWGIFRDFMPEIERFAKLIELRYQKKIANLELIISQRYYDVLQEREALCKAIEEQDTWDLFDPASTAVQIIRARGQQ